MKNLTKKILTLIFLVLLTAWGCAKGTDPYDGPGGDTDTDSDTDSDTDADADADTDADTDTDTDALCGNGVLDSDEECDNDTSWSIPADAGVTCEEQGYFKGTVTCNEFCNGYINNCSNCGNGVVDTDEACERMIVDIDAGPDSGVDGGQDTEYDDFVSECLEWDTAFLGGDVLCSEECTLDTDECHKCGNSVVDTDLGEVCDDGVNDNSYDGCKPGCLELGPYCSDGELQSDNEECDDGNADNTDECVEGCFFATCGDGFLWTVDAGTPEECDEGDTGNDGTYDGCDTDCTLGPRCGDGNLDTDHEECDDADTSNTNDCVGECKNAVCGDGFVWDQGTGTEVCDDANTSMNDDCANDCTSLLCEDQGPLYTCEMFCDEEGEDFWGGTIVHEFSCPSFDCCYDK